MNIVRYGLLTLFLPTFAYALYWLQFEPDRTSTLPWLGVLLLGLVLCAFTIWLVIVKTHDIKKLGIAGREQKPQH